MFCLMKLECLSTALCYLVKLLWVEILFLVTPQALQEQKQLSPVFFLLQLQFHRCIKDPAQEIRG